MLRTVISAFLLALVSAAHANSFESALSQAVKSCTALAPGHESELGNVNPDEVNYWFEKARFEASHSLWSDKGITFLERQLRASTDELRTICIRQLLAEARAKDEVPPDYSCMDSSCK